MEYLEKLKKVHGNVIEVYSPSGFRFVIRQQNGEDDDTISNAGNVMKGDSANAFVASIVVDTDFTVSKMLTIADATNLKLCDKYFIMLVSRIFSLGQTLKFEYHWGDNKKLEYEEDLGLYIWDYSSTDFPYESSNPLYFKYRIPPHKWGKASSMEFTTESGRVFKIDFSNGHSEKYLMNLPDEKQSRNQEYFSRNLQLKVDDKWIKVESFKIFNPKEMMEIRNRVDELDPVLEIFTEIENPEDKKKILFPIFGSTDFFFPREI